MKKIAGLLLAGFLCAATSAAAMFPGTGEGAPGFVTVDGVKNNLEFHYPRMTEGNFLHRIRVNSAVEREMLRWEGESIKAEEGSEWLYWFAGYTGEDAKSFILTESLFYKHAAHPTTYAKGMTFDAEGRPITREEILKKVSAKTPAEIRKLVFEQTTAQNIMIFEEAAEKLTDWPQEFYIAADGTIYFIFQQYEIAPYAAGFIEIAVGRWN